MTNILSHSHPEAAEPLCSGTKFLPVRVVLLRNFLAPYEIPWIQALARRVLDLQILASRDTHSTLPWAVEVGDLKVVVQGRLAVTETQRHPAGFADRARIHLPYGTFKHLRRLRPDVIISSELGARTLQALAYASWVGRVPLVAYAALSERTEVGRGRARRILRSLLLRHVRAAITPGASGARYLERLGTSRERIFVAPRTTEMKPFLDLPLTRDENSARRLFFPGQFVERKGLLPFLDVLSRWGTAHAGQTVEFWLLGDGPQRSSLEAHKLPPNLTLRFLKAVPYHDLPMFYAQAGILAFPTLADEWGLVVNEALASGLPVLGSVHSQATEELIVDGANGWAFNPDRPDEAYRAIDRALTASEDQLGEMRAAARQSVEPFTPEFAAGRVLQALRSALSLDPGREQGESARAPRRRWGCFR